MNIKIYSLKDGKTKNDRTLQCKGEELMQYNITLSLEEKATIEACLLLGEQKLYKDADTNYHAIKLKDVQDLIKKLDEVKEL